MKKINAGSDGISSSQIWVGSDEIRTIETMDAQPILDQNQRLRSAGVAHRKGMRHVATIDRITYHNWRKEWKQRHADKWEWKTWLAMKLRDRDYSKFRTSDMKI